MRANSRHSKAKTADNHPDLIHSASRLSTTCPPLSSLISRLPPAHSCSPRSLCYASTFPPSTNHSYS